MGKYNTLYNLGINYRKIGDLDASASKFKEAIQQDDKRPTVYNNWGLTEFERSNF